MPEKGSSQSKESERPSSNADLALFCLARNRPNALYLTRIHPKSFQSPSIAPFIDSRTAYWPLTSVRLLQQRDTDDTKYKVRMPINERRALPIRQQSRAHGDLFSFNRWDSRNSWLERDMQRISTHFRIARSSSKPCYLASLSVTMNKTLL